MKSAISVNIKTFSLLLTPEEKSQSVGTWKFQTILMLVCKTYYNSHSEKFSTQICSSLTHKFQTVRKKNFARIKHSSFSLLVVNIKKLYKWLLLFTFTSFKNLYLTKSEILKKSYKFQTIIFVRVTSHKSNHAFWNRPL